MRERLLFLFWSPSVDAFGTMLARLARSIDHQREKWRQARRQRQNLRILESLPEEILQDIGWPYIDNDAYHPDHSRSGLRPGVVGV